MVIAVKPKRACSAWIIYNTEMVKKLKEQNSDLSHKEAFTKSAEIWKQLDTTTKAKFEAKSKAEDDRYNRQFKELENKGFFTHEDGTRSCDVV